MNSWHAALHALISYNTIDCKPAVPFAVSIESLHVVASCDATYTPPPERLAEVIDFVDFIAERESERKLVRASQTASEASLRAIWDNDADAAYDRL